jgi:hypothetical protein
LVHKVRKAKKTHVREATEIRMLSHSGWGSVAIAISATMKAVPAEMKKCGTN